MLSIAVDSNYDIYIDTTAKLGMVRDKDACTQDCLLASQMLSGEYPYDTTQGVTYLQSLFQNKNPYEFEQSMIDNLMTVPNVLQVDNFKILQQGDTLYYSADISTSFGQVTI